MAVDVGHGHAPRDDPTTKTVAYWGAEHVVVRVPAPRGGTSAAGSPPRWTTNRELSPMSNEASGIGWHATRRGGIFVRLIVRHPLSLDHPALWSCSSGTDAGGRPGAAAPARSVEPAALPSNGVQASSSPAWTTDSTGSSIAGATINGCRSSAPTSSRPADVLVAGVVAQLNRDPDVDEADEGCGGTCDGGVELLPPHLAGANARRHKAMLGRLLRSSQDASQRRGARCQVVPGLARARSRRPRAASPRPW